MKKNVDNISDLCDKCDMKFKKSRKTFSFRPSERLRPMIDRARSDARNLSAVANKALETALIDLGYGGKEKP